MIYCYYSDRFSEYNFGPHHPLRPVRLTLASEVGEEGSGGEGELNETRKRTAENLDRTLDGLKVGLSEIQGIF